MLEVAIWKFGLGVDGIDRRFFLSAGTIKNVNYPPPNCIIQIYYTVMNITTPTAYAVSRASLASPRRDCDRAVIACGFRRRDFFGNSYLV